MKKVITLLLALAIGFGLKAQCPLTQAVDFTATDVHGTEVHLFDILDGGQYVLIDFFFTTCGPCQQATPKVVESYYAMGCNMHDVFYMEIATGDSDAACLNWVNTYGVEYPTISGAAGGTGICNQYQIPAYPTLIVIAPDHSIVIQDLWPINNAQTIITTLEGLGLQQHDCNEPVGELTITPDTLWFSQMGEELQFTILNETAEDVTIEDVILEEGSYLNIYCNAFPITLVPNEWLAVIVTLQTPPMPPAKDEYTSSIIRVATSLGDREVVAMIPNVALDLGLIPVGSPYTFLDIENPSLELSVLNSNAGTLTPIQINSIEEGVSEGGPYLNIELSNELPFTLNAGDEYHFIISPLYTGAKSTASTSINVNYDGGTLCIYIEIDGELLKITELDNELMLYPNPANDFVTLKGESLGMVSIFNAIGQMVNVFRTEGNEVIISTANYENGVYIVKTEDGKAMRFVVKH